VTPVTPVTPEISFQPADSLWRGACTKFIPVRLTRPSSTCGHVRCTRACNTCARLHRPVILSSAPLTLSLSKHLQPVHRMCDTIPDCTFIMPHIQFAVACACALDRCSIPQKLPVSRLDLCEEGLVPEPFGLHGRRSHLLARRGSTAAWPPSASPAPRALAVRSCHRVFWRNAGLPAAMTLIRASLGIGRVVTVLTAPWRHATGNRKTHASRTKRLGGKPRLQP
jgi:hypothetical protein